MIYVRVNGRTLETTVLCTGAADPQHPGWPTNIHANPNTRSPLLYKCLAGLRAVEHSSSHYCHCKRPVIVKSLNASCFQLFIAQSPVDKSTTMQLYPLLFSLTAVITLYSTLTLALPSQSLDISPLTSMFPSINPRTTSANQTSNSHTPSPNLQSLHRLHTLSTRILALLLFGLCGASDARVEHVWVH